MEGALLMDMDGDVLHEWRYRFPDADVLAIITGSGLVKIDKDSELLWPTPTRPSKRGTSSSRCFI
jgi:hypothetical protein